MYIFETTSMFPWYKSLIPGEVDFLCDLSKGRFNVTANVNQGGKICSVKIFDKSDVEGDEASKREFKNLKTLKHEKIVSFFIFVFWSLQKFKEC